MKQILSFTSLIALIFVSSAFAVTENQLRVIFNGGTTTSTMSCNSNDMVRVLKAITLARRYLRQNNDEIEEHTLEASGSSGKERKLPVAFYPATCKTSCSGYATGTCVAPGCKGFRRELEDATKEHDDRDLQSTPMEWWCPAAKNVAGMYLDALVTWNRVAPSCVNMIKARSMDCLVVTC